MRYIKLITALAVLGLIYIGFASAAATCPTLSSVKVFVNNKYVGSDGTFTVNVGDHVDIQVCCQNKMTCPATLSLKWIDGQTYRRTIKANTNSQCEMFYFQINSQLTKAKCAGPIKVISNCLNCGQTYTGSICIKTNTPPNTPSIPSGSASGKKGTSYSYSASSTDPDKDKVKLTFDWGDGTTSVTSLVNSGASTSASHKWSKAGTYLVKAKATDSNGADSISWSNSLSVKIT